MFANRASLLVGSGVTSTAARRFSTFFHPLPSVAIIGGGIGGLACANALLEGATSATSDTTAAATTHRDIVDRVVIYEQADRFVPTSGAGFGFAPNGQICLASIGIPKIQSLIHPFDRLVRLDGTGTTIRQSSDVLSQLRQRHGFGLAGCLRADLVDLLVQSLDDKQQKRRQLGKGGLPPDGGSPIVQYSCKLTHIQQTKDKVELAFSNGHSDVVDLVVGADGIHTTVAKMLDIDHSEPLYSGANIFYGVIPDPNSIAWSNEYLQPDAMKHTILQSAGLGPPDRSKLVWAATYASDVPPVLRDEWDPAQNVAELDDTILSRYPSTHPIHDLAAHTPVGALLHFGMYYRKHKTTWYQNRVVLLGDSCHATLPYVGQGANQAIEDAIVLADCLAKHLLPQKMDDYSGGNTGGVLPYYERAYAEYYHQRFPRTKRIVDLANLLNPLYHSKNPIMPYLLDFVSGQVLKGGFLFRQLEKEIVDDCPVKDYARYRP